MTLLRRLIAFFYLLFRVVQRSYFQAQKQWEKCGSWNRWSQCFLDRASFRCYWHGAKQDFSRLYEGWRHGHAVSLNGNSVEADLLELWWVNVGDLVRELETRCLQLRNEWQKEKHSAEVFRSELYAAWIALEEKEDEIHSLRKSLATKKGVV